MKYKPTKNLVKTRAAQPIPFQTKDGIELRCPFCDDHHSLHPNKPSPCGTRIEVTAIQEVYTPVFVKKEKLTCVKCHKQGGEMVRFNNTFVHTSNCSPEKKLLQELPNQNPLAKIVFKLPAVFRKQVERFTGKSDCIFEIDELGNKTGKIVGYVFWKAGINGNKTKSTT